MKCSRCHEHPATSVATGLCSACLYEEQMGKERADRQRQLAASAAERERKAQDRRAGRS